MNQKWHFWIKVLLTIVVIVNWVGLPVVLQIVAIAYFIYAIVMIVIHGLSCVHCWKHLVISIPLMIIALISLPVIAYVAALIVIWGGVLTTPSKR